VPYSIPLSSSWSIRPIGKGSREREREEKEGESSREMEEKERKGSLLIVHNSLCSFSSFVSLVVVFYV